jgi:hypothetical protein
LSEHEDEIVNDTIAHRIHDEMMGE